MQIDLDDARVDLELKATLNAKREKSRLELAEHKMFCTGDYKGGTDV
jgi:hypothetical protein